MLSRAKFIKYYSIIAIKLFSADLQLCNNKNLHNTNNMQRKMIFLLNLLAITEKNFPRSVN